MPGAARAAVTFALLWGLAAAWTLGVPRYAGPDEPSHVQRAAALIRGDVTGRSAAPLPEGYRLVRIPVEYGLPNHGCFAFQPLVPASCLGFPEADGDGDIPTAAGRYPPAYYALVAPASLVAPPYPSIWLMRLLSAAVCAALATAGLEVLRRHPHGRATLPVLLLALTPMAFFLFGIVSPSGVEVAAAFAVWLAALVLATGRGIERPTVTVLAVAGAAMALTRPLSPAWLAMIIVTAGVLAERRRRGVLLRSRAVRLSLVFMGVASLFQVAWTLVSGAISAPDPRLAIDEPFSGVLRLALGDSADQLVQMIGNFGWLDTPVPGFTLVVWFVLLGAVLLAAFLVGTRRQVVVLGSLVVAVLAVPVVADIQQASSTGIVWQGRYTLPLAIGVPIVAAFVLARTTLGAVLTSVRGRVLLGSVIGAAQLVAFYWMLRRFSVGDGGRVWFWTDPAWEPPLPSWLLLVGYAAGWAVLLWWLLGSGARSFFPSAISAPSDSPTPAEGEMVAAGA